MDPSPFDAYWLDQAKLAFAALCGGLVRLLFRPSASILKSVWLLFACVTCGYYGTPPALHWFAISPEFSGGVGAIIGLVGVSIAERVLFALDNFNFRQILDRMMVK